MIYYLIQFNSTNIYFYLSKKKMFGPSKFWADSFHMTLTSLSAQTSQIEA